MLLPPAPGKVTGMFSFVVPSEAGVVFFWRRWAGTTLAVLSSGF